jgi:hypothetical protein
MSKFHPDDVPNDALKSVSQQLGDWFDATTVGEFHPTSVMPGATHELPNINEGVAIAEGGSMPSAPAPPPSFELRETFAIWSLSIDRIEDGLRTDKDLVELARWTGRWHHQVVCNERPVGFARSTNRSVAALDVCQLYTSDLAKHIDDAITWLDEFEAQNPDNAASNRLVRLLFVPSYQTHAFWLIKEPPKDSPETLGSSRVNPEPVQAGSDVLIIDAPSYLEPLRPLMMLTSNELLEALREKEPLGGGLTFSSSARSDD